MLCCAVDSQGVSLMSLHGTNSILHKFVEATIAYASSERSGWVPSSVAEFKVFIAFTLLWRSIFTLSSLGLGQ